MSCCQVCYRNNGLQLSGIVLGALQLSGIVLCALREGSLSRLWALGWRVLPQGADA